jgi:hypothetical protein
VRLKVHARSVWYDVREVDAIEARSKGCSNSTHFLSSQRDDGPMAHYGCIVPHPGNPQPQRVPDTFDAVGVRSYFFCVVEGDDDLSFSIDGYLVTD